MTLCDECTVCADCSEVTLILVYRGDGDESQQATVDWSWGTVKYRLGSSDDDADECNEPVSSPPPSDVQPPSHTTPLQVRQLLDSKGITHSVGVVK